MKIEDRLVMMLLMLVKAGGGKGDGRGGEWRYVRIVGLVGVKKVGQDGS